MADYQLTLTANDIISRVMGSFGLPLPASAFSSTDGNVIQMVTLLNDVGQEMIDESEWGFMDREMNFVTTSALTYDLPADFDRFVPDSAWNYSTRLPMVGSVTEQQWQMLKARNLGGMTIALIFRVVNNKLEIYEAPSTAQQLVLPYVGRGWVRSAAGDYRDNCQEGTDVVLYDSALIRAALTLAWLTKKGLDTTSAQKKYDQRLTAAKVKQAPAPTLSLVPGSSVPLLGQWNVPDTGYGN